MQHNMTWSDKAYGCLLMLFGLLAIFADVPFAEGFCAGSSVILGILILIMRRFEWSR